MERIFIICLSYPLQLFPSACHLPFTSNHIIFSHGVPGYASILLVSSWVPQNWQQLSQISQLLDRGLSTRQISKNSFFRVSQHSAYFTGTSFLGSEASPLEDITVYNFLMRILRHRKAKCSAHECSSLDLNSNRLTWWPYFLHHTKMLTAGTGPCSFFLVSVLFCPMSMRDRERVLYGVREGNEIRKKLGLRLESRRPWMLIQGQILFFRVKDIQILLSCPCPSQKTRARPPRQHGPRLVAEQETCQEAPATSSPPPHRGGDQAQRGEVTYPRSLCHLDIRSQVSRLPAKGPIL